MDIVIGQNGVSSLQIGITLPIFLLEYFLSSISKRVLNRRKKRKKKKEDKREEEEGKLLMVSYPHLQTGLQGIMKPAPLFSDGLCYAPYACGFWRK